MYDPLYVMQDSRRILETDGDLDEDEIPDNMATISPAPAMPNLTARINGAKIGMEVRMRLRVSYERHNRNDVFYFPGPGQEDYVDLYGGQAWTIPFGGDFLGGDATLTYEYCEIPEETFDFKIYGLNPEDSVARAYIEANAGAAHWFAWAIARHESKIENTYYNQFNSLGTYKYHPNWGTPDGWGIMQVDSERGTPITVPELWNWHTNVAGGLAYIGVAQTDASSYFSAIQRNYPNEYEAPPASYTPNGTTTSLTALEAATIQLYNGASIRRLLRDQWQQLTWYRSCWRFDENAPSGDRWEFVPNQNNYVENVIRAYEEEEL